MKDFRPGTWKNPESAAHKGFNVHGTRPRRKKRRRQETARFIKAVPDFQLESEDVLRRPRTGAHLNFNEDTESESKSRTWRWTPKLVLAVMEILSGTRTVVQTLRKTPGLVFGVEARNRVPPVIGAATFWFINGNQCGQKIFMPPIGADCFFFFSSPCQHWPKRYSTHVDCQPINLIFVIISGVSSFEMNIFDLVRYFSHIQFWKSVTGVPDNLYSF